MKGADQLSSYCTADLRLSFRTGKIQFPHEVSQINEIISLSVDCKSNGITLHHKLSVFISGAESATDVALTAR